MLSYRSVCDNILAMEDSSINACKWNALRVQFWKSRNQNGNFNCHLG